MLRFFLFSIFSMSTAVGYSSESSQKDASINSPITINLVGDMMLGTNFPENVLADDDGVSLLQTVAPFLRNADITFGNLEGVLLDEGEPAKSCLLPENCYLFRTPSHYVNYLREAGFDVMSLANNHARDFGESGLNASMATLASAGIRHSVPMTCWMKTRRVNWCRACRKITTL